MNSIDIGLHNDEESKPLTSIEEDKDAFSFDNKVSVISSNESDEVNSNNLKLKIPLMPEESVEISSDSHTTVRQIVEKLDSATDNDSDHEISSLHERPKSVESVETSESEVNVGILKRSGTDSSDYELHSSIILDKEEAEEMSKQAAEKSTKEALMEEEELENTFEHKPLPLEKQQQQVTSTELLQKQIKDDMYEQVLLQDNDSVMSESTIKTNASIQETKDDEKAVPIENVKLAEENIVVDPEWEIINQEEEEELEPIQKRSMTPEQALEVAAEIVTNVQFEAIKKYEEMVRTNQLPKPQPDSKFTEETKTKVEDYIRDLEEKEEVDEVAFELIQKVVSKKEKEMKSEAKFSVDISEDEVKSDAMLAEMRNELRRQSISVTDEDLVADMTQELLQEQNIEEMKKHLEDTQLKVGDLSSPVDNDFRFKSSFRTHFVGDVFEEDASSSVEELDDKETDDIWAEDSKVILRKDYQSYIEKRSDNESASSSGNKSNLKVTEKRSDYEGYSSAGETSYFSAHEHLTSVSGQSRPTSSDVDALLSAVSERSTTDNSEFLTAQDHSSADTSHYYTAASTMSNISVKSSESSGHLGSIEVSECSETLVESSLEFEHRAEDGSETPAGLKYDDLSCDEVEPQLRKSPMEFSTVKRTHVRNPSSSSIPILDLVSPQEMQCLPEDDVDGTCFSSEKDIDEDEKQPLISDNKFHIPDLLASKFSGSRETLSSSVYTASETTILERGEMSMKASTATLNQIEDVFQTNVDMIASSVTTMSSSSHSSWSTNVNLSPPKTENMESSILSQADIDDQVFPLPRMQENEGVHSVQDSFPHGVSVDFGSDYDSRPNSELKDVESRPLSTDRMSRTSSNEALNLPVHGKRSYSIDDTVSDNLRVLEPYARPKSPMPQQSIDSSSGKNASVSESEDRQLRQTLSAPVKAVSPLPPHEHIVSADTLKTELAFSQHFTQNFDENDFEIIKTSENPPAISVADLTPDSQLNSESMEISQEDLLSEGKSITSKIRDEHDDLLVGSPPMVSRPLGVKYWPPVDNLDQDYDTVAPVEKRTITRSESDDNSECKFDLVDNEMIEKDVEEQKKWLESQFDGNQNVDDFGYGYGQPLDQILEEEEDRYSHSSEDIKELQRFKESLSSTPDFDQIMGKKYHVSKSGEQDDLSMGSLTEFERLEREVALGSVSGSGSHGSLGSNDSLETNNANTEKPKSNLVAKVQSKSGTGDDVSVNSYNSLKSFEMMEQACKEAEINEKKAKQQEEVLSEIEEGHESQDSESAETISEFGEDERSEKDYEDRLFEIDNIIKQAQANVEKFDQDKQLKDEISLKEILGRPDSKTESVGSNDSLEDPKIPDLPIEPKPMIRQSSLPTRIQSATNSRTTSVTSLRSATSTVTQFDPDSFHERDLDLTEFENDDLMQASMDSLDGQQLRLKSMVTSTDSLEGSAKRHDMAASTDSLEGTPRKKANLMTISTDSIENLRKQDEMTTSIDSLEGDKGRPGELKTHVTLSHDLMGASAILLTSTDSIESTSTNTRATASMLSSVTSQGSETLVADDEFEHDYNSEECKSARKYLLDQGNLPIDDSDDSATYSNSSPVVKHKTYQSGSKQMFDSVEEMYETEEIDEKGNIIVKKVIQKRLIPSKMVEITEKKDDSCEETIEEIDEFGNKKNYIVKRTLEQSETSGVIQTRREQKGLSPVGEIFKNVTDVHSPHYVKSGVHHTEKMTKIFDAPSSTPSPPASPPSKSFRSQIPVRKQ